DNHHADERQQHGLGELEAADGEDGVELEILERRCRVATSGIDVATARDGYRYVTHHSLLHVRRGGHASYGSGTAVAEDDQRHGEPQANHHAHGQKDGRVPCPPADQPSDPALPAYAPD